jgi:hypothetical protein
MQSQIEKRSPMTNLKSLNRCIGELVDAQAWWKARTQIEQANPLKFSELVRITESSLMTLLQSTNPAAASLIKEDDPLVALDVNGFVNDILSSMDEGTVRFSPTWMDKYYHFFDGYNEWYSVINNLRLKGSPPPTEALMVDDEMHRPRTSSQRVAGDKDGLTTHAKLDILWDPDEFLLRTSTAVMMAPPLQNTSVNQMAKMLNLDAWMAKNAGRPPPPKGESAIRGVVSIIGASQKLDEFILNGQDDAGAKLPDLLSGEEALARLRMVFSRGIIAAAHNANAVVITSGYDMGRAGTFHHVMLQSIHQLMTASMFHVTNLTSGSNQSDTRE